MSESFSKKELAKRKAKEKQDKAKKMQERKANNNKGKSLEDMMAYIDEDGNIVDSPPVPGTRKEVELDDIQLGAAPAVIEPIERKGMVSFYNEAKGYGFITDDQSRDNVFFHNNQLSQPVKEKDRVSFEREKTPKGFSAINIKKLSK
jgi:cold shock CspA family protein